jgi:glycosyltransferase involved in cell wall biosynthesis
VPPAKTGSVELIVGLMAEELSRRGHDVTVFASQDSRVSARVASVLPTGYQHDSTVWDWELAEYMQLGMAFEHAGEFDLINSHVEFYALPFTRLVRTPTVHTFHHIHPASDYVRFCRLYPEGVFVSVSRFQRRIFSELPIEEVVHYGIDTASFPFGSQPGTYLVYLGDFCPEERPLESIRCARAAGIPIKLAGRESKYFHEVIRPELDGHRIEYVGEVDHDQKRSLLRGALATLFLAESKHACPLVVLESMACGTPVLALDRGPVPELMTHGAGGICAEDFAAVVRQIPFLGQMNRDAVRRLAVERFDASCMVSNYLAIFERVLARESLKGQSAGPFPP